MQGRRLSRWVPLALIFVAALANACAAPAGADELDVSGRVTASTVAGGHGIEGALVSFVSDTGLRSETVTGADGRYAMRVLSDHPFGQVIAEVEGFVTESRTVYFDRPERRIDLVLRRPSDR